MPAAKSAAAAIVLPPSEDPLADAAAAATKLADAFSGSKPTMASTTIQAGLLSTGAGVLILFVPVIEKALGLTSAEDVAIGAAFGGIAAIIAGVQTIIGRFKANTKLH